MGNYRAPRAELPPGRSFFGSLRALDSNLSYNPTNSAVGKNEMLVQCTLPYGCFAPMYGFYLLNAHSRMRYCWKALVNAINSCAVDWSHEMVGIDIIGGQNLAFTPLVGII